MRDAVALTGDRDHFWAEGGRDELSRVLGRVRLPLDERRDRRSVGAVQRLQKTTRRRANVHGGGTAGGEGGGGIVLITYILLLALTPSKLETRFWEQITWN